MSANTQSLAQEGIRMLKTHPSALGDAYSTDNFGELQVGYQDRSFVQITVTDHLKSYKGCENLSWLWHLLLTPWGDYPDVTETILRSQSNQASKAGEKQAVMHVRLHRQWMVSSITRSVEDKWSRLQAKNFVSCIHQYAHLSSTSI